MGHVKLHSSHVPKASHLQSHGPGHGHAFGLNAKSGKGPGHDLKPGHADHGPAEAAKKQAEAAKKQAEAAAKQETEAAKKAAEAAKKEAEAAKKAGVTPDQQLRDQLNASSFEQPDLALQAEQEKMGFKAPTVQQGSLLDGVTEVVDAVLGTQLNPKNQDAGVGRNNAAIVTPIGG